MKRNRKKYDFAFKEKAVLLSYNTSSTSLAKLEKELGLYTAALSSWRREYEKFNTKNPPGNNYLKLNTERLKIQELEKRTAKSNLKFEILKKSGPLLNSAKPLIFKFIQENKKHYSVRLMCEVTGTDRGSYRAWENPVITERQKRKLLLQKEIAKIFYAYNSRYGSRRITIVLQNSGYQISSWTVNKYMNELGLSSRGKRIRQ